MEHQTSIIYIVENEKTIPDSSIFSNYKRKQEVNFTIPGQEGSYSVEKTIFNLKNSGKLTLALQLASLSIAPVGAAAGIASGVGLKKLFSDSSELSETERLDKEIAEAELTQFLENHAVTAEIANRAGFQFPPGHPRAKTAYRLHPLAGHADDSKNNLYIPHDNFDELLFEEREAELVKLLIKLGATRISIKHLNSQDHNGSISGSLSGGNKIAEASASAGAEDIESYNKTWDREFILNPPKDCPVKIDENDYAWLKFEPNWKTILIAREHGGCTKASIELKEKTAFSSKYSASLDIDTPTIKSQISGDATKRRNLDRNIFIEVEFFPVSQ